jgi:hypothetical protein
MNKLTQQMFSQAKIDDDEHEVEQKQKSNSSTNGTALSQ